MMRCRRDPCGKCTGFRRRHSPSHRWGRGSVACGEHVPLGASRQKLPQARGRVLAIIAGNRAQPGFGTRPAGNRGPTTVGQGGAAARNEHKRRGARRDVSRSFQRHPDSPDIPRHGSPTPTSSVMQPRSTAFSYCGEPFGRTEEAQSMTTEARHFHDSHPGITSSMRCLESRDE